MDVTSEVRKNESREAEGLGRSDRHTSNSVTVNTLSNLP